MELVFHILESKDEKKIQRRGSNGKIVRACLRSIAEILKTLLTELIKFPSNLSSVHLKTSIKEDKYTKVYGELAI